MSSKSLSDVWLRSMGRIVRKQQTGAARAVLKLLLAPASASRATAGSGLKRAKRATKKPLAAATTAVFAAPLTLARRTTKAAVGPAARRHAVPRPPADRGRTVAAPVAARSAAAGATAARSGFPPPLMRGSWTRGLFKPADGDEQAARGLHYWLYWPSDAPASPRPLVVMLHGCCQTATAFAQGTRMNDIAQRKGFAVLYPQQSVTSEASRCWPWYSKQNQRGGGDARTLRDLVRKVLAEHPIDRSRVYVAGISAGAGMAQILALSNPEMFAAVGMHSGPVFGCADSPTTMYSVVQHGAALRLERALEPVTQGLPVRPLVLPALLIHGDCDKVVRPVNLMQVARQFALLNGFDADVLRPLLREHPARSRGRAPRHGYRTLSYLVEGKPRLVVCQVEGLEHAWSGGVGGLPFNSALGPDASAMLWSFFSRQRRRAGKAAATG